MGSVQTNVMFGGVNNSSKNTAFTNVTQSGNTGFFNSGVANAPSTFGQPGVGVQGGGFSSGFLNNNQQQQQQQGFISNKKINNDDLFS
jgi:hypothetical protein